MAATHLLDKRMSADEFRAFIRSEVEVESAFTEGMNETPTLTDYLADLRTRIERLMDRDDFLWEDGPTEVPDE